MADRLQLEIVTPQGMVLSQPVDEVVAPSVHGEFGVLPGHLPLLAALEIGLLSYTDGGDKTQVAVGIGFAEVLNDKTVVLTDRFIEKDDVDILHVRERLKEVDEQIEAWEGDLHDAERLALIEEEAWLAAQLELIGDPPVARILETAHSVDYTAVIPDDEPAGPAADADADAGDAG